MSESKKLSFFGYEISKKMTIVVGVIGLFTIWMFGGEQAKEVLINMPEEVDAFSIWLQELTKKAEVLGVAVVAAAYVWGQSKVDASIAAAKGQVGATKAVVKGELNEETVALKKELSALRNKVDESLG